MRNAEDDLKTCEAATDGPWTVHGGGLGWEPIEPPCGIRHAFDRKEDADFCAMAREALPHWINRAMAAEKATQPTP